MALARLDNVEAKVGTSVHHIELAVDFDGLVVGRYGKLPFKGSRLFATGERDGCHLAMEAPTGGATQYFIPASCFASHGGRRAMGAFLRILRQTAVDSGASVAQVDLGEAA